MNDAMHKTQRLVAAVTQVSRVVINAVLDRTAGMHVSQAEFEGWTDEIIADLAQELCRDFDVNNILSEQDVIDPKGNVNATAVIAALEAMASRTAKKGAAPQLNHLAQNFKHVFTQHGFLRPVKESPDHA